MQPGAVNGVQAFSTPPRVPALDDEETPPPPTHVDHKPPLPDRPARATRHLTFEPTASKPLLSPHTAAVRVQAAARQRLARRALRAARADACRQCYEMPAWFWLHPRSNFIDLVDVFSTDGDHTDTILRTSWFGAGWW